ncbi:alanine racemase/group IV decarboxylase [Piptocephalis cylindrospora]|uniref:Alanine racemase/group IV decarboxylase n=1 Tax=Piptocephalis cylindrospora TaxID=1907219 RepID=A0A4V1IXV5_9FUNG|nr:alanine racemase/group IV decarboxylase [Piptocephalis cylindrospora]|eukprot:RKP12379.1 alanine racemase/group IV decarboxylase [Piptocephalis cylindrospora]
MKKETGDDKRPALSFFSPPPPPPPHLTSFHVGTGSLNAWEFAKAIAMSRRLFDIAQTMGFNPTILDIGGGFPGDARRFRGKVQTTPFPEFAQAIRWALERFFPEEGIRVIAEPGRFIASGSSILVTQVQGKRLIRNPDGTIRTVMYYMNEGAMGSFPHIEEDSLPCYPDPVESHQEERPIYSSIIWGPTCCPIDAIIEDEPHPEMYIGEWYAWRAMGAYMASTASSFNGFLIPRAIEVDSELE